MYTTSKLLLAVALSACSASESTTSPEGNTGADTMNAQRNAQYSVVLENAVQSVILPTYEKLEVAAADLLGSVEVLAEESTEANLLAVRGLWMSARVPWEQSEAFLFGPVADYSLDPSLDSWPVDRVQLNQVLASGLTLSSDAVTENFGGGLRGFHTIEYLLWGADHEKTAADLANHPRELKYLVAAAEVLSADASLLYASWASGDGGGFAEAFTSSGEAGGRYQFARDAVDQLINGMRDICDEVANGKIADPYDEQNAELVESQFSYNSVQDFSDNLRSVRNVYLGTLDGSEGEGITRLVAAVDQDLDARVRDGIEAAIESILEIGVDGVPFRDAIFDPARHDFIEAAQDTLRTLMSTLDGDVRDATRR